MTEEELKKEILEEYTDQFFASTRGRNDIRREKIISTIKHTREETLKEAIVINN